MEVAVVTGASRGIGYALSKELHSRGVQVIATARSEDKLKALQAECDGKLEYRVLDLSDRGAVEAWANELSEKGIQISHLINNAGSLVNKPFGEITAEELRRVYEVNVFSVFEFIQRTLGLFTSDVHVVNISSMGGFQGSQKFPGLSAYSSSKAAVASLTECLQEEFAEKGWAFNALCLGAVQTEMLEEAFPGFAAPTSPEEMAVFIADFAMGAQKYLKGKVLPISSTTP
ncbi:MAG: SDR family oxidoreductase [Flavobacteriia bacterium]|nr:SDR family oxidoreductase [Flavobacteriia bacterium]